MSVAADPSAAPPPRDPAPLTPAMALREALIVFGLSTLVCAVLVQLRPLSPFIRDNVHGLIAAVFLFVPTELLIRRREDFDAFGLTHRPLGLGLVVFLAGAALVFPAFGLGFWLYYRRLCALAASGLPLPRPLLLLCARFVHDLSQVRFTLPRGYAQTALTQLLVVGLPEEYFFRGYLQTRLDQAMPPRRQLLGARVGAALLWASLLFALGHFLVDFNALRLAVFFPALVFGWMRARTGSILSGVLFHASANIVSDLLHKTFFHLP